MIAVGLCSKITLFSRVPIVTVIKPQAITEVIVRAILFVLRREKIRDASIAIRNESILYILHGN